MKYGGSSPTAVPAPYSYTTQMANGIQMTFSLNGLWQSVVHCHHSTHLKRHKMVLFKTLSRSSKHYYPMKSTEYHTI